MAGSTPSPSEVFYQEAIELLEDLEAVLLDLEHTPDDSELINRAFRALHTIKGSGAMFGYADIAAFTHGVESAFQKVRDGLAQATPDLITTTLEAEDHIRDLLMRNPVPDGRAERLEAFFQSFAAAVPPSPQSPQPGQSDPSTRNRSLTSTTAPGEQTSSGQSEDGTTDSDHASSEKTSPTDDRLPAWHIRLKLSPQVMAFGTNPLSLLDELRDLGECVVVGLPDTIPGLDRLDPLACHMEWDIYLSTDKPRSAIEDIFLFVMDDARITITPLHEDTVSPLLGEILIARGDITADVVEQTVAQQRPLGQLLVKAGAISSERVVSALVQQRETRKRAPSADAKTQTTAAAPPKDAAQGSVRVGAERLDGLMDQVGELVIAQARLRQLANGSSDPVLRTISEEIERLATDLRDTTMGIRMVPIGTLFSRFRRVVRDLSQSLSKDVSLTTDGDEAEMDKTVIERLNDPLVHLIRNAIDHGLEPAADREAAGKPPHGSVHLSAAHSGGQILITISDDGRGMDHQAIRAKAEERGLVDPDACLSNEEILDFIFHPGFSTAKTVSSVSGRGVGLDVVKRTIDALRGTISVKSVLGEGSAITLCLPLTLAIIDGLLVRVGAGRYVIPLSAIEECVELPDLSDVPDSGCDFLNLRGSLVPYLFLKDVFHDPAPAGDDQKVVVVALGNMRIGLVVDQVIGQHQTVIKSLSKLLSDVREFSGATILGDGSVALIVDIARLIELGQKMREAPTAPRPILEDA